MVARIVFAALISLLANHLAHGHEVWIERKQDQLVVLFGHGERLEPYDPVCVKQAKGFDETGKAIPVDIVRSEDRATLVPTGNPSMVTAFFEAGYRVKTTDGKKKIPRSQAVGKYDVIEALKSIKCIKAFVGPSHIWDKPVGQYLEIVPQKDPMVSQSGDLLSIKVLLEGKPVEGIVIATGGRHGSGNKIALKTDKEGIATVKIERSGLQIISAHHKMPLKGDPEADVLYIFSTMTFEAK